MDLTDAEWAIMEPLFRARRRADGEVGLGRTRVW
jgi:hypothetical protein